MAININVPGQQTFNQRGAPDVQAAFMNGLLNYIKANEAQNAPQMSQTELAQRQAQTQGMNIANQFAPQKQAADLALAQAHAAYFNQGGALSGPNKEAVQIQKIKDTYGEDSPEYQNAKQLYDLKVQGSQSLNANRNMLTNTADKRFSTNLGKTLMEQNDINQGVFPGTNAMGRGNPISSETQQQLGDLYGLKTQQLTTDLDTRKRNLFATNLETTMSQIDPSKLTAYTGVEGLKNLAEDKVSALNGKTPQRLQDYKIMQTKATSLAKQASQFWGSSIQPSEQAKIEFLANPATWDSDPATAIAVYKSLSDVLNSEMRTYRGALKNTKVFQGPQQDNSTLNLSPEKIQYTAQKYGLTPEQVIARIKGKTGG